MIKFKDFLNETSTEKIKASEETFKFIPVEDDLPKFDTPVLLKYKKGKKSSYGQGNTGIFYTQGILKKIDFGHGVRVEWQDYTDRLLQTVDAPTSKNEILAWAYFFK